jgi:hypothetical protein
MIVVRSTVLPQRFAVTGYGLTTRIESVMSAVVLVRKMDSPPSSCIGQMQIRSCSGGRNIIFSPLPVRVGADLFSLSVEMGRGEGSLG